MWGDDEPVRRTLRIRDRQILWERAGHKCQCCEKQIDFTEMQVGHKIAASKGGRATLKNTVCLCYKCNKLQGTDSWRVFLRKMGKQTGYSQRKNMLKELTVKKLKFLSKKFNVKVKGSIEEGWFEYYEKPPTKTQYVNGLAKKLSEKDIKSALKDFPVAK